MAMRPATLLPRLGIAVLVVLLATATITFAAETRQAPTPAPAAEPTVPTTLLVPDVRRQAYVFAKTMLEESGFAWRVTGPVAGYAANTVATQSPAPGTLVQDTGAPMIVLTLSRGRYPEDGAPENASSYPGTAVVLPGAPAMPKPAAAPKKVAAPQKQAAPVKKKAAPAKKKPAAPVHKPAKPAAKRPPAFTVPGAKPEPLNEIPLPARARALDRWLTSHTKPTDANVRHWLYQHAWIVTGARLGWWRGEEALELLLQADARVQEMWEIGARSEAVARAALAEVRRKSR
jgi:PASTA domain